MCNYCLGVENPNIAIIGSSNLDHSILMNRYILKPDRQKPSVLNILCLEPFLTARKSSFHYILLDKVLEMGCL